MKAAKYNMTEEELVEYCSTLPANELKKFQLDDKMEDINMAKSALKFFVINTILCIFTTYWAYNKDFMIFAIIVAIIGILSICFIFGYSKRVQQEQLMYRMFEIWFEENNIL
jgi:hypothetical protein